VELHVSLDGRHDLSGEIYRQLRAAILERRIRAGEQLPPTRELARRLGVSRTTATVAYDRLIGEGFAEGRTGAGTFASRVATRPNKGHPSAQALRPRPDWQGIPLPRFLWTNAAFDFRPGRPEASLFPYPVWRRLMSEYLQASVIGAGSSEHPAGQARLRSAIARHVALARGIRAIPDDVVVTNGTQQAIDLIGRVLLQPGDQVAVEDPGYGPPARLLRAMGAKVKPVPVDGAGLIVDAIPPGTSLVYVTPSHQFPLGVSMSLARRLALLEWARRHDAAIIEDDYDSEFRFGGRPIEPIHALDDNGRVVYVGSFSKTMLATLRLGYVIAPASLHEALYGAKYLMDWHTSAPIQAAMAGFIEEGQFARHLRRMRLVYEARHARVTEIIARTLSSELELTPSAAGLHVSAVARDRSVDEIDAVVRHAASLGVACQSLAMYARGDDRRAGLVLGYGRIATEQVEPGLERLVDAFQVSRSTPRSRSERVVRARHIPGNA
jgi:GntR family transcriptional regulator / MocR family aminotransferase